MVKVIIQMDGEEERVISGEFASVVVVSEAGNKYEACNGIVGEIDPDEVPGVLAQATVTTMNQAYEHLTPEDCIVKVLDFLELFNDMILDEIAAHKEELDLPEDIESLVDFLIAAKEVTRDGD